MKANEISSYGLGTLMLWMSNLLSLSEVDALVNWDALCGFQTTYSYKHTKDSSALAET
jgi:hypothetical protein